LAQPVASVASLQPEQSAPLPRGASAAAVVAEQDAALEPQQEAAARAEAAVLRRAAAVRAGLVRRRVVVRPSAVPWVCRPGRLRRPPAPQPAVRSGRAMERLRIASP
jgi:hypothetical protein